MIVASAVITHPWPNNSYPVMFTGLRHANCLELAWRFFPTRDKGLDIQGFITDKYEFLDRYDAKHHARKCNQLIEDSEDRRLYSEDIWAD